MAGPENAPQIFFPDTVSDLIHLRRAMADALIYAGGTYILKNNGAATAALPPRIISLQEIEELDRVSRTERHLEVGSMVSIKRLLMIGRHVVPRALYDALEQIAPPGVKNLATLGGNLCIAERNMTASPVLQLMDAALELRRHGSTRWIHASRFRLPDGSLDLVDGDVLTRIRIPLDAWNIQEFRRFGTEYSPDTNPLSFCGLARINKSIIEDVRLSFSSFAPGNVRNRDVEADLIGRKLPVSERDIESLVGRYEEALENSTAISDPFQRKRALRLTWWFLNRLSQEQPALARSATFGV